MNEKNPSHHTRKAPPTLDVTQGQPPPSSGDGGGSGHHHFHLRWTHDDRSTCRSYRVTLYHMGKNRKVIHKHGPIEVKRSSFPRDGRLEHTFTGLAGASNGQLWRCEIRGLYDPVDDPVSGVLVEPRLADEIAWVYEWPAQRTRGGQRPLHPVLTTRQDLVGA